MFILSEISIAGSVVVYGGDIAISESLNTTTGGANRDILLKASGYISLYNANSDIHDEIKS